MSEKKKDKVDYITIMLGKKGGALLRHGFVNTIPVPGGEKIYEWEYLDDEGKLQKNSKNIHEEIQSHRQTTEYVEAFKTGVIKPVSEDSYVDLRDVPDNGVGGYDFETYFKSLIEKYGKGEKANVPVQNESKENTQVNAESLGTVENVETAGAEGISVGEGGE